MRSPSPLSTSSSPPPTSASSSKLFQQSTFAPLLSPSSTITSSALPLLFTSKPTSHTMSISQTFHLAHRARGKLSAEASRSNHNLRVLVGHANLLDSLMLQLANAEADQERWFNKTVRGSQKDQRLSPLSREDVDDEEEDYGSLAADYDSDSDSDSDSDDIEEDDEDDFDIPGVNFCRTQPKPIRFLSRNRPEAPIVSVSELNEDYESDEDTDTDEDETEVDDDGMFLLTRTKSHRPPSLCSDSSDDDDDLSRPPSPPQLSVYQSPLLSRKDHLNATSYFESNSHHDHQTSSLLNDESQILYQVRLLPAMISTF